MSNEEYKLKVAATLDLIALELSTIRLTQDELLCELRRQGGTRTDAVQPRYEKIPVDAGYGWEIIDAADATGDRGD